MVDTWARSVGSVGERDVVGRAGRRAGEGVEVDEGIVAGGVEAGGGGHVRPGRAGRARVLAGLVPSTPCSPSR